MDIRLIINTCGDCRHKDHSGAFTPGGAKAICGHDDAPKCATNGKELEGTDAHEMYHWKYRVLEKGIPAWCPLSKGYKY